MSSGAADSEHHPKQRHAMANEHIDVDALYGALNKAREMKDTSWRELSRAIGVSASTMSRMAQGQNPDVNAFAKMVSWLGMPAERFIVGDESNSPASKNEPELVAEIAPLLRARKDLSRPDIELLEALIESAVRRFAADRQETET
ncbi:helix-turn-helix transcriptional regulator [Pseudonocardia sp. NPDC049154]|uniref:helix-turn-helix domain-containing protein n=1 Tax=Pseudonocardia sp. NPDC049154 TaxID=3155501 RepID=UPI0033C4B70B